jgi:hypothetical protein
LRLSLLLVLVLTSATLIVARWRLKAAPVTENQGQRTAAEVEAEVVTATPTGFEPVRITRSSGRFLLAVENASGLDELNLYLERETGVRVNAALSRRGKLKWREIIDLPPGHYILRAANDESWRCNINLTPR